MLLALLLACGGAGKPADTSASDTGAEAVGDTADDTATDTAVDTATDTAVDTDTAPPAEACNGLDDDGDGTVDEAGADGCVPFYEDADGDGVGSALSACLCAADGAYTAAEPGDCDDADASFTDACPVLDAMPGARLYASEGEQWPTGGSRDRGMVVSDTLGGEGWVIASADGLHTVPESGDVRVEDARVAWSDGNHQILAMDDFDGDGIDDLATVRGYYRAGESGLYAWENYAYVFRGPLVGSYGEDEAAVVIEGPRVFGSCCSMDAGFPGDIDGDGTPDLVVTGDTDRRVPMDGSPMEEISIPGAAKAVGDLDGDGLDEMGVVTWGAVRIYSLPLPSLVVSVDDADATFSFDHVSPTDVGPAGDMDGDGIGDLRVEESGVWVVARPASGHIDDVALAAFPDFDRSAVVDMDGDGRSDLACGAWAGGTGVFTGPLAGTYEAADARWQVDPSLSVTQIGAAVASFPDGAPWALAIAGPASDLGGYAYSGEVAFFAGM